MTDLYHCLVFGLQSTMEYHFFISFFAALSRAAGFSFLEAKKKPLPKRLFTAYCWISEIFMGFYVFRIICRLLLPMSLPQVMEWIPTFLYVFQVYLKSMLLKKKNPQIVECVNKMNSFFEMVNKEDKEVFADIWKSQYGFPNRFCMVIFGSQIVCLVLAYIPSFYNSVADPTAVFITFPSYYFFINTHYGFKVGYLVLDYITSNFCCMKTSTIEMLYLTFISYHVAALRYLKVGLKNIFDDFSNGHLDRGRLKLWVDVHKEVLSQIILFKSLVRNVLLVIYIYNLLNVVTMTLFVSANGDMELNQKMVAIVVVTVTLFYFFWDCILTDQLEYLHSNLMFEAFIPELAFDYKDVRQSMIMSTTRCRLPLKITAGGVFAPSCWNFKELLTTTSSFLIALWEVKNRAMRQSEVK